MFAANRVILAVAVVSVAIVGINAKPVTEESWSTPFETALKNITSKLASIADNQGEYATAAKNTLTSFSESFKSEFGTLSKVLEGKAGVNDLTKEAAKQWQTAVDTLSKNVPETLSPQKFNEQLEKALKTITENSTELYKKAGGNSEIEKEIKEFTKKQIDSLLEQAKAIQTKFVKN